MPDFTSTLLTPRLPAAPTSPAPTVGQMYYDTSSNLLKYWNGTAWVSSGASGSDPLKVDKDSVVVAATRIVASKLISNDPQPAFVISGDGTIKWGPGGATAPDTSLSRLAAGAFGLTGGIYISAAPQGIGFSYNPPVFNANSVALQSAVFGENVRFAAMHDGKLYWGPGGATAPDTNLYRTTATVLKTDGSFRVVNYLDVDNGGSGAQIRFGSAYDTNLYRSAANTLKTDGYLSAALNVVARAGAADQVFIGSISSIPQIVFGSANDTNLYRLAAGFLHTDSSFSSASSVTANRGAATQIQINAGVIYFGSAADTNLYRSAAGTLKTDGVLDVVGKITDGSLPLRLQSQVTGQAPNNDLDQVAESGWVYWADTTAHAPQAATYGYVHTYTWEGVLSRRQIAYLHGGETVWARNVPGPWRQIYPITDANLPIRLGSKTGGNIVTDCNLAYENGWYHCGTGTNAPVGGYAWMLLVSSYPGGGSNWTQQIALSSDISEIYFRTRSWNGWSAWMKIYPSASSGGGSVLSAIGTATSPASNVTSAVTAITGATVTLDVPAGAICVIHGTFDMNATTGGGLTGVGYLYVDGAQQTSQCIWLNSAGDQGIRGTVGQHWRLALAAGTHTFDLRVAKVAGAGSLTVEALHTRILVEVQAAQALSGSNGIPQPVVNGQWIKGVGGAAVWAPITDPDLPVRIQGQNTQAPANDANSCNVSGWYYISPGGANVPAGGTGWWKLFTVNMNTTGNVTQTAYRYENDETWSRRCKDGSWTTWLQTTGRWIQSARYASGTIDGSLGANFYYPTPFPGYPSVTFSSWNDGMTEKLMIIDGQPSYFRVGGVNYGTGRSFNIDWIAVY